LDVNLTQCTLDHLAKADAGCLCQSFDCYLLYDMIYEHNHHLLPNLVLQYSE